MAPPDRRPRWEAEVLKSNTLLPQTKLVLLMTMREDMTADGKVRPDRARVARRLGIRDPKLVNKRWKDAMDAGYLGIVHRAAYGSPAQYEARMPDRPTVREVRTVMEEAQATPTVRVTGDSGCPQNTDSSETGHSRLERDEKGRYCPQITDGSIPERSRDARQGNEKSAATEEPTTSAEARSHATRSASARRSTNQREESAASKASPPEAVAQSPASSSPAVSGSGYASPVECPHGIPNGREHDPWEGGRMLCARCSLDQTQSEREAS